MQLSEYIGPTPEAFRGFIEGVQSLQDYLRTNAGERLVDAKKQLDESLAADPDFAPAQYYKAVVLTHFRKSDEAISLLEGLNQANPPFKTEVLYNLAFAYSREYDYDLFKKSLELLDEAYKLAHHRLAGLSIKAKRTDLVLLIQAMRAFVMAAFAGRHYDHKEDLEKRQREYLPESVSLAQSVLADPRLKSLAPETKRAIELEAHNAAGIAYMRMGQYSMLFGKSGSDWKPAWLNFTGDRSSELFGKSSEHYWKLAEQNYAFALHAHPGNVRVLDNISTLNLIQASSALGQGREGDARRFSERARDAASAAISRNQHDQFRHYNLAKSLVLLREWDAAREAADRIMDEPGRVTKEDVEKLKQAIDNRDVKLFLVSPDAAKA